MISLLFLTRIDRKYLKSFLSIALNIHIYMANIISNNINGYNNRYKSIFNHIFSCLQILIHHILYFLYDKFVYRT